MFGGHGFGFGGGFMWWFSVLLFVVVFLAVKAMAGMAARPPGREKSARQILEERYARGEIDKDEFEQKRRDLG